MKFTALLLAVTLTLSGSAFAELAASHTAAVEKLLAALQIEKQLQASLAAGLEAGLGASEEQLKALPQAQQDKFKGAKQKMIEAMTAEMSWEKLKPDLIEVYGRAFTEKEAQEVTALVETPAGKLYVSKQGAMVADMAKVTQSRMTTLMPKLMQIMQEEMQK